MQYRLILCCLALFFLLMGCDYRQQPESAQTSNKEILIYCGSTMAKAIQEIADIFELQEMCIVKIINEGSGVLYRSIQINQAGDLYLPSSEYYIDQAINEGLVVSDVAVGCNHAVMVVAKDNPLNISADLTNLVSGNYRTALGDPKSCAIGRKTEILLESKGLRQQAYRQALFFLLDSRALNSAILNNEVDLVLNWLSVTRQNNSRNVSVLPLAKKTAGSVTLRLGLLSTAHHKTLAQHFMALASSAKGQAIFTSYGFGRNNDE